MLTRLTHPIALLLLVLLTPACGGPMPQPTLGAPDGGVFTFADTYTCELAGADTETTPAGQVTTTTLTAKPYAVDFRTDVVTNPGWGRPDWALAMTELDDGQVTGLVYLAYNPTDRQETATFMLDSANQATWHTWYRRANGNDVERTVAGPCTEGP